MKKVGITLVCLIVALVAVTLAWNVAYPSGTWRYKITVEVETPEGIKTGSAVREVTVQLTPKITPETKPTTSLKGEAVVVDLGKRGVVFALLKGHRMGEDHGTFLPFYAFPFWAEWSSKDTIHYYRNLKAGPTEIEPDKYPLFVRFRDQKAPKTIENLYEVDWCLERHTDGTCTKTGFHVVADRFEDAFGEGVRLKSVTVEMTDAEITRQVKTFMPSYEDVTYMQWFRSLPYGDPKKIGPYNFIAGDKQ